MASYNTGSDVIAIDTAHVWGERGIELAAHEYGHAFHHIALGGFPDVVTDCSFHGLPTYTSLSCAFVEGFAEYYSVVTRPDANFTLYDRFEVGYDLLINPNPDSTDPNDPNGSLIEGAVAAFLLDVTDPANEPHDAVAYPAPYLADVIETCRVGDTNRTTHADGIDHIIRCLENQVDATINGYFHTRSPVSTSYSESATEPPGVDPPYVHSGRRICITSDRTHEVNVP